MNEIELDQARYWEQGWRGHELAQMRRMARLSLSEKLVWLEEAHRLVEHLRSSARTALAPWRGIRHSSRALAETVDSSLPQSDGYQLP